VRIDYTDPDDVPDEPRLPRPPDGPSLPDSPRPPDTAPPPLPDPAERDAARRANQDLVNAAYADYPEGKSDTMDKPATGNRGAWREALPLLRAAGEIHLNQYPERPEVTVQPSAAGSWSRGETGQLSREQDTEAALARADSHDEGEQVIFPAMPHIEAADPSCRMTGLERMRNGQESLYCPVSKLKGDEPGTAGRLMDSQEFNGGTLRGFKDPTGSPDYIDEYKRTYDAVGGPSAWGAPELNMNGMINQIKRHLYQKTGVDFTVLDLTGASSHQIDEVFESLDRWAANPAMHPLSKLIILGDGF
jgi:hypothetical protein